MFSLKKIKRSSIPKALEKIQQYRLLNEPIEAESICRDILEIEPDNQKALIQLILTLTDQFTQGIPKDEAFKYARQLTDPFDISYYTGIIYERKAKAVLRQGFLDARRDAFEWFVDALQAYEKAEEFAAPDNDDAILRWNACIRTIIKFKLGESPKYEMQKMHLQLE